MRPLQVIARQGRPTLRPEDPTQEAEFIVIGDGADPGLVIKAAMTLLRAFGEVKFDAVDPKGPTDMPIRSEADLRAMVLKYSWCSITARVLVQSFLLPDRSSGGAGTYRGRGR